MLKYLLVFICLSSLVNASCSADDVSCEDPIRFETTDRDFFIEKYSPINGEENVVLDVTLSLEFSDSIPLSQGFQSFFFLLNQFTGVTTEIPASCVVVKNSYSLEIPVVSCLGDVLEADTAYVFYVAQRLNGNQIETLSSVKNVPINERAFNLVYKSIHFRTVDNIAVEVVKEKCLPAFDAKEVSLSSSVEIAFSSPIHIGFGKITLVSTKYGADITVDVTDKEHCVIRDDQTTLVIFGFSLLGSETYQVTFPTGIVLSASGSKCSTVSDYFFTTMPDAVKPAILFITPSSYSVNFPTNTVIRIAFSEYVKPGNGIIVFKNAAKDILVNVESMNEVHCHEDVCTISPAFGFEPGVYEMSFGEATFVDYSDNTLQQGVKAHVFRISETKCGLSFVNVDANEKCTCQSVNNQCQCQCGETHFVKDY